MTATSPAQRYKGVSVLFTTKPIITD